MPNARKKGLKLAGAFVEDEIDKALVKLARKHGFPDKASYLRDLFDKALQAEVDKTMQKFTEDTGLVLPPRLQPKRKPTRRSAGEEN
jgi:hypothetical protein